MIFIAILSVILIFAHVSSLRFIIKANKDNTIIEQAKKLETESQSKKNDFSLRSGPGLISLLIIILLNLVEMGYFIACVYIFNNLIVLTGSSILAGYTIFSLIKFIPNIKKYHDKPSEYLKERTKGLENILNYVMTSLEIIFCIYILILTIFEFRLLEMI